MDALDADVFIYAAVADHPLGRYARALFSREPGVVVGVGSVLLLPELLAKPVREGWSEEVTAVSGLLSRLDLRPVDTVTAEVATALAASYRLRPVDAALLATAAVAGADRFVTNNRRDFRSSITEIDVVYPEQLAG